jgi:hypothetical protein
MKLKKDHMFMLGIEEEFEIVAVGFGPSKLCKAKKQ